MSPDSATFYHFFLSERLCSRFTAKVKENQTFVKAGIDQNKVPAVQEFYLGFAYRHFSIEDIYFFEVNTKYISSCVLKTSEIS